LKHFVLIVTVDTEEEGLWGGNYRSHGNTVTNVRGVARFQDLCQRHGIQPTYLVDTPVVESDECVELLGTIQQSGACEIGAHLHPWCAPPLVEAPSRRNSFTCNLPEPLQREKLTGLTDAIQKRFGVRPTSFRAGRYGLDGHGARILIDLGYEIDSSVIAYSDFSNQGGPNFMSAPETPYRVDGGDLCMPDSRGRLWEAPVSVGYQRFDFRRASRLQQLAGHRLLKPLHVAGLLDRTGIVRRIKFSPEQATASNMRRLVDRYRARGAPCMVMMLHSSSLAPGFSPYVPTRERLDQMLDDLDHTFRYCVEQKGMTSMTMTQFARHLSGGGTQESEGQQSVERD